MRVGGMKCDVEEIAWERRAESRRLVRETWKLELGSANFRVNAKRLKAAPSIQVEGGRVSGQEIIFRRVN